VALNTINQTKPVTRIPMLSKRFEMIFIILMALTITIDIISMRNRILSINIGMME
jgi:hypothetical protein